jgi:hypothetical protein
MAKQISGLILQLRAKYTLSGLMGAEFKHFGEYTLDRVSHRVEYLTRLLARHIRKTYKYMKLYV